MADKDTNGLLILIAPSRVWNHFGNVLDAYLGKLICNFTIHMEQILKLS